MEETYRPAMAISGPGLWRVRLRSGKVTDVSVIGPHRLGGWSAIERKTGRQLRIRACDETLASIRRSR